MVRSSGRRLRHHPPLVSVQPVRLPLPPVGPRRPWRSQAWRRRARTPRFLIGDSPGVQLRFSWYGRRPTSLFLSPSAGLVRVQSFLDVSRAPNNIRAIVRPSDARLPIHPAWPLPGGAACGFAPAPTLEQPGDELTDPVPLLPAFCHCYLLRRRHWSVLTAEEQGNILIPKSGPLETSPVFLHAGVVGINSQHGCSFSAMVYALPTGGMVVLNGAHRKLAILRAYFYLQRRGIPRCRRREWREPKPTRSARTNRSRAERITT